MISSASLFSAFFFSAFFVIFSLFILALAPALVFAQGPPEGEGPGGPGPWTNFTFNGTIKNSSYDVMTNVNVSVWTMSMGPDNPSQFLASNLTDNIGNYSITVLSPGGGVDEYGGPVLIKMTAYDNDGNAIWTNPPIPPFPAQMITGMLDSQTLYVVPASTVFVLATNESDADYPTMYRANFSGALLDDKFGADFDQFWPPESVTNRSIVLAQGRNYTLTVMKMYDMDTQLGVPPLTFTIYDTNLSENAVFNMTINITTTENYLTGNLSIFDETLDTNITITDIAIYPTGNGMFPGNMPPMQIPNFDFQTGQPSFKGFLGYNLTDDLIAPDKNTTFFNATLIGTATGIEYVVGVFGHNSTDGTQNAAGTAYYAMWQNFTITTNDAEFNLTLQRLAGNFSFAGQQGLPANTSNINISVAYNMSGQMTKAQQGGGGLLTIKSHNEYGKTQVKVMAEPDSEGSFKFPMLVGSNVTFQMFNKQFAPKEMIINLSAEGGQNSLELKNFDVREPGREGSNESGDITGGTFVAMYTSNSSCNVQVPSQETCQLFNFSHEPSGGEQGEFNPIKFLLGEKLNVYILPPSGPSVYMIDVDLMASGPPDFNPPSAAEADTTEAGQFDQLWKVGSTVPNMVFSYSYVGLPYNASHLDVNNDVNITLDLLYNSNYDIVWNASSFADPETAINGLPDDFQDFLPDYACYFNTSSTSSNPCRCSISDTSQICYISQTDNRIYLNIKHFTGDSPHITGDGPLPNLTAASPLNGSSYNSSNISISFDYSDGYDQCWVTGVSGANESNYNCTELNGTTVLATADVLNNITLGLNDTSGNINSSDIFFYVDTIVPSLALQGQTPDNLSYANASFVVNVTLDEDLYPNNCWIVNGSTGSTLTYMELDVINDTLAYCNATIEFVATDSDYFNYTVWVNDTAGNLNSTEARFITVDLVYPSVTGVFPNQTINGTISITSNITFNISDRFLNETYISTSNFAVIDNESGSSVGFAMNYSHASSETGYDDIWIVTLDPYVALAFNTIYTINISGIYDVVGNPLSENYVFNLTTGESDAQTLTQIVGNASYVDTNLENLSVTVNGTEDYENFVSANETQLVQFANLTGGTYFEFNYTLSDSAPLSLHNVTFQVNPNETRGSAIIRNLDLAGGTKNIFIDNLTATSGVCLADTETYDSIDDFSENCTGAYEVWVACPGTNASYACEYDSSDSLRFKITGLSNSLVLQTNDTIPPNVLSMSSPSATVTSSTATLTVTTNENATCRYSANAETAYDSMSSSSQTSLGTTHSFSLSGLSSGTATYYVKCADAYSNAMHADYTASFTVSIPSSTTSTTTSGGSSASVGTVKNVMWSNVAAGTTISKEIAGEDFPVAKIDFAIKTQKSNVALAFTKLSALPMSLATPSGKVYSYVQLSTTNVVTSDLSGNAVLNMRVKKSWLTDNSASTSDIVVRRWSGTAWTDLATTKTAEDATYYYFDAQSPGFSYYVIGTKGTAPEAAVTTAPSTTTASETATPTEAAAAPAETPVSGATEGQAQPETGAAPAETSTASGQEASAAPTVISDGAKKGFASSKAFLWSVLGIIVLAAIAFAVFMSRGKKGGIGGSGSGSGSGKSESKVAHEHAKHDLSELKK